MILKSRLQFVASRLTLPFAVVALSACHTTPLSDIVIGAGYQPSNVFAAQARLPAQMRRVAVLPLGCPPNDAIAALGRDTLQPVYHGELAKTKMFELVFVTPDQLRQWSGKPAWGAEETLPPDFLTHLRESLSCDAVMFGRLTHYRPYRPPALGWSLKLVDCREGRIYWAADEVFDSGDQTVVNSARRYYQTHLQTPQPLADSFSILSSPRLFAQYTLHALFGTLPLR
jgi:hypothetical protein